ncbi:MAG: OsmC family protein, partial [Thermodesulfobacteriota bacterium]
EVVESIEDDSSKAKKVNKIEGEWNTSEGVQFTSLIQYEGGKVIMEAEQPTFLGGSGTRPGPMHYCMYGSASCYTATFATLAAMEGIKLRKLKVTAESYVNFSKVLGLADNPIIEGVKFTLEIESDAPEGKLKELEELARERCPAVYCLTNPIKWETELKV